MLNPIDELEALQARSTGLVARGLERVARASLRGDQEEQLHATRALGRLIYRSQALADLLGRRRLLLESDAVRRGKAFSSGSETPVVPEVPFLEAIEDLISRDPRLANGWEDAQRVYTEEHGFVLAKSASRAITARVQDVVARSMRRGATVAKASEVIQDVGGFAQAYADTVYRTNVASAYTAGRFRQARDPDVAEVVGGFTFMATRDSSTRPNHLAADGLTASTLDPVWDQLAPPLGYNCRCAIRLADVFELERAGKLFNGKLPRVVRPPGARPDDGFRSMGRPDRSLYGE